MTVDLRRMPPNLARGVGGGPASGGRARAGSSLSAMTDASAMKTPGAVAIPTARPIRKAPAGGGGVNSRRIATMTSNGDRAIASA